VGPSKYWAGNINYLAPQSEETVTRNCLRQKKPFKAKNALKLFALWSAPDAKRVLKRSSM